ncbi:MAG: hypothetical protein GYA55_06080, partial [SAR324 cluster bacterium]|nr:hypothetical protein [SAR324 cluster bacterium]
MDTKRLRELPLRQQALVAVAVLLDGIEAGNYLENDAEHGSLLKDAAESLASQRADLRMPLAGTILR